MAAKITGATKLLHWSDFPTRKMDPPGEGEEVVAAYTDSQFHFQSNAKIAPVHKSDPVRYYIKDNFILAVTLVKYDKDPEQNSWVASWVKKEPKAEREALLDHERGHYGLVALLARDCFNELRGLLTTEYDSVDAALADWNAIVDNYQGKLQPAQDTYDSDLQTRHGFNRGVQAIWNGYLAQARSSATSILTVLGNAGIYI